MSEDGIINVAMVSTGTGDGGIQAGTAVTAPGQPNVVVTVVTPLVAIAIRAAHFFLKTTLGLVTAGTFSESGRQLLGASDAATLFTHAAWWAIVPTLMGVGWDFVTIFAKLEQKFPLSTGNV